MRPDRLLFGLRITALLEGISYIILLGIAMPLKYVFGQPEAVRIFGMAHGILFIVLCLYLVLSHLKAKLPIHLGIQVFIASLIPFGAFWADWHLQKFRAGQR